MGVGLWLLSVLMSLKQASAVLDTWTVVLPDTILGFHGACVLVPCQFTIPERMYRDLLNCAKVAIGWGQVPDRPSLIGSPVTFSQGEKIGDERRYNCTTVFSRLSEEKLHTFHVSLDCSRIKLTQTARISLQRAPPPPQLDGVHVHLEGELVELQCSVPVPCPALPPSITWLPQDDVIRQQTRLQQDKDHLLTLTSTLTFIASANHHNRSLTCSASYPLLNGSILGPSASTHVLSVLYAPRSTEAVLLRSGHTLTLVCSSDANPPVSVYSWFRVSQAGQLIRQGQGKVIVLPAAPLDGGVFLCEAKNTIGSQRSRPVPLLAGASVALSGSSFPAQILLVLWGVLFLLYILMVAVHVHKYQRLSRRLKQIEAQEEHIYTNLRRDAVASDYDQIQQPGAAAPTSNVPDYVIPLPGGPDGTTAV